MIRTILRAGIIALAFMTGQAHAQSALVVGGKKFTEQQLIAEMTNQLLQHADYKVDKRVDLGSSVLRAAQENGQIDIYWEYTGTSLITYNGVTERLDPQATYERVKKLDAAKGLVWLDPSKANNTYALAMNKDQAQELGIASLSDLARVISGGKALRFASNAEFYSRTDGLRPLQELYGFEFARRDVSRMDGGLTYQALRDRQVDVALVLSTDGRIPAFNFVVLKDDKGFFPAYALTPVVRASVLEANPKIASLLNSLSAKLDDDTMATLNARVDVARESIEGVSRDFLTKAGLL